MLFWIAVLGLPGLGIFSVVWLLEFSARRRMGCVRGNHGAPKVLHLVDDPNRGRAITIRLSNGDPCLVSFAQTSILIKKNALLPVGRKIFCESDFKTRINLGQALMVLYPNCIIRDYLDYISSLEMAVCFNAIMHCSDATEVGSVFKNAIVSAEQLAGRQIAEIEPSFLEFAPYAALPKVPKPFGRRGFA